MQTAAIIFLVLWVLVGTYTYRAEVWRSRTEALISALLMGFVMTLGFIVFICMAIGLVAVAVGFI
jgi:uncharacterized membrane protein